MRRWAPWLVALALLLLVDGGVRTFHPDFSNPHCEPLAPPSGANDTPRSTPVPPKSVSRCVVPLELGAGAGILGWLATWSVLALLERRLVTERL
ncbi:MAG: hypothetical protein QOE90_3276 [Thermoplasmata archaeon]|jgi:hypothetical protein|nr:hypothetical protein [Thermoplasmata archaeon]